MTAGLTPAEAIDMPRGSTFTTSASPDVQRFLEKYGYQRAAIRGPFVTYQRLHVIVESDGLLSRGPGLIPLY